MPTESSSGDVATPVKIVTNKQCLLCTDKNKRLFCLKKQKAVNEHYAEWIEKCLNIQLPSSQLHLMCVCEKCAKMCKSYCIFKAESCDNIQTFIQTSTRKKRMPKQRHIKQEIGSFP